MGGTSKDKRDVYYRQAKQEGWRARSAFKLLQIEEEFNIFCGVERVVDLCAAPGSWSQVLSRKLYDKDEKNKAKPKIVSVDLQAMASLPGVVQIQGDITKKSTVDEILEHFFGEEKAELVVCDGAPDVCGIPELDQSMQDHLILAALSIATFVLRINGTFVCKIFEHDVSHLRSQMGIFFRSYQIYKPPSSRSSSIEAYIIGKRYAPPVGYVPQMIDSSLDYDKFMTTPEAEYPVNRKIVPFVACGDYRGYSPPQSNSGGYKREGDDDDDEWWNKVQESTNEKNKSRNKMFRELSQALLDARVQAQEEEPDDESARNNTLATQPGNAEDAPVLSNFINGPFFDNCPV